MFNNFFGDMVSTLSTILLMIAISAVVLIYLYDPLLRALINIILCIVILFVGVQATVYNVEYLTASGTSIGEVVESIFVKPEVDAFKNPNATKWTFTTLGFNASEDSLTEYTSEVTLVANTAIDLKNKDYDIYLNGIKLDNRHQTYETISAQLGYNFRNEENGIILTDTLKVSFYFYNNNATLKLTTYGGDDAVRLWYSYQIKNGFTIELKETTIEESGKLNIIVDTTGVIPDIT